MTQVDLETWSPSHGNINHDNERETKGSTQRPEGRSPTRSVPASVNGRQESRQKKESKSTDVRVECEGDGPRTALMMVREAIGHCKYTLLLPLFFFFWYVLRIVFFKAVPQCVSFIRDLNHIYETVYRP
jgi:hypothetical protein